MDTTATRGELEERGPFSRAGSFEEGGGSEAAPGPLFPSRGRLGYTFFRPIRLRSEPALSLPKGQAFFVSPPARG